MRLNMKKFFGLILLFGILFLSCGNSFHTKSSKSDAVDVTLQIPAEVFASLSSRNADDAAKSNTLEVSLFVNDEEPIVKIVDFSNSANVSFPNIAIGSIVKAKANLKYEGKEYSGESAPAVVTESGAQLILVLKQKKSSGSGSGHATNTQNISLYFDNILLDVIPLEEGETVEMMVEDLAYENFTQTTDYTIAPDVCCWKISFGLYAGRLE